MEMWTVKEIKAGDGVVAGWYLRGRGTQYWFGVAKGWKRDDVQLLADRRNAREAKPRYQAKFLYHDPAAGDVWAVRDDTINPCEEVAVFNGGWSERHAREHADKLNKECGQ